MFRFSLERPVKSPNLQFLDSLFDFLTTLPLSHDSSTILSLSTTDSLGSTLVHSISSFLIPKTHLGSFTSALVSTTFQANPSILTMYFGQTFLFNVRVCFWLFLASGWERGKGFLRWVEFLAGGGEGMK